MKRKAEVLGGTDLSDDGSTLSPDQRQKRQRAAAPPLMSELLTQLWTSTAPDSL